MAHRQTTWREHGSQITRRRFEGRLAQPTHGFTVDFANMASATTRSSHSLKAIGMNPYIVALTPSFGLWPQYKKPSKLIRTQANIRLASCFEGGCLLPCDCDKTQTPCMMQEPQSVCNDYNLQFSFALQQFMEGDSALETTFLLGGALAHFES